MNIVDALKASRDTRRPISRRVVAGWVCYSEAWIYHFCIEELLADDWMLWGEPMPLKEWEIHLKVQREEDDE